MIRLPVSYALGFTLVLLAGCAEPARNVAVFPVDGQLFVAGQPASGATISFHPINSQSNSSIATANVRPDGHFMPVQAHGAAGLPEGTYRLTVTWTQGGEDRLQGKYADVTKPIAQITVQPTVNLLAPISIPAI